VTTIDAVSFMTHLQSRLLRRLGACRCTGPGDNGTLVADPLAP
jgi:hypothetical protein